MEEPVPGIAPTMVPMMEERKIVRPDAVNSSSLSERPPRRWEVGGFSASWDIFFSAWMSTSLTANRPMSRGTRPMPPSSVGRLKVKRSAPEMASSPTRPNISPMRAERMPFDTEAPVTLDMTVRPMTSRPKKSAGPNLSAIAASGMAATMSAMSLNVSPRVEE